MSRFNILVSSQPWRLFEFADQWFFPPPLRRRAQDMLAAQWTRKLPFIQDIAPAGLAVELLDTAIQKLERADQGPKITVIDFCSGAGGPTPVMEQILNERRRLRGQRPIDFVLSDLHPNLDSWLPLSENSGHLSFIPQPVDATDPPIAAISETSQNTTKTANGEFSSDTRVFRLYCLAFHHFNDTLALKILTSTMETADGFAILELQDRRITSLLLMIAEIFFTWLITVFWFPHDWLRLLLTYIVPLFPLVHGFDGIVSALRTRTFDEMMQLVVTATSKRIWPGKYQSKPWFSNDYGDRPRKLEVANWTFEGGRKLHTWPLGYMNYVVGRKDTG